VTIVWTADHPRVSPRLLAPVPSAPNRRIDLTPSFDQRDQYGRTSADVDAAYADADAWRHTSAAARTRLSRALCVDAVDRYLRRLDVVARYVESRNALR
jgi:hypothetical protein